MGDTAAGLLSPIALQSEDPCRLPCGLYSCEPRRVGDYQLGTPLIRSIPAKVCSPRDLQHQEKEPDEKANIISIFFGSSGESVGKKE